MTVQVIILDKSEFKAIDIETVVNALGFEYESHYETPTQYFIDQRTDNFKHKKIMKHHVYKGVSFIVGYN